MKRRITQAIAVVALAAVALAVVGCSSSTGTSTQTNPEPPGPITLTKADTGSTQQLQTGQELILDLEANPTTGYEWAIDGSLPPQLEQSGEPKMSTESTAIGAGGTQKWVFVAKSAGSGALRMKYWRSFEAKAPPVETFEVNVEVK